MTPTKTAKKPATQKATKAAKASKPTRAKANVKPAASGAKKLSAIDAAAQVLATANEPMNTKALIEAMATQGLWTSPGGKTPHATLYSALIREINEKAGDARFRKTERGHFAANK